MDVSNFLRNDSVFSAINKQFCSLSVDEVKEQNAHVLNVIDSLIQRMKLNNTFFSECYTRTVFTGSFYKRVKVTKPNEFDVNLVIKLPVNYIHLCIESTIPGYIQIKVNKAPALKVKTASTFGVNKYNADKQKDVRHLLYSTLLSLLDNEETLNTTKFRAWMEKVIAQVCNTLEQKHGSYLLQSKEGKVYELAIKKSGPAFTVAFKSDAGVFTTIDLVPVLEIKQDLPQVAEALSTFTAKNFYVVPKLLLKPIPNREWYWRLSFPDQEKCLLSQCGQIKPVLRQMKKLRDTQNFTNLKSYFIETICYYMAIDKCIRRQSSTQLFYSMLCRIHSACEQYEIRYFWDNNLNLLENEHPDAIRMITNRLSKIIKDIEKSISVDPYVIAKYILTTSELNELKKMRM